MRLAIWILIFAAIVPADAAAQATRARYRVTFHSTWNVGSHPVDFPANPHFSGLVGATHNANASFWAAGSLASAGIEQMAETGAKTALLGEVTMAEQSGFVGQSLSGGGISRSPGMVSIEFDLTPGHPLVTLVSMLAPSPDWFVGVAGLDLRDGATWRTLISVPLDVYDAGSDHGASYSSPNQDADPAGPIAVLQEGPFSASSVVGRFHFDLIDETPTGTEDEVPSGIRLGSPFPMPAERAFRVGVEAVDVAEIEVFDAIGRVVWRRLVEPGTTEVTVPVAGWVPGWYLLVARSSRGIDRRPIVVR